ncbi:MULTISPECIES: aminoglycoside N(3)-acetyltransferase [Terrabacteria group]|uniref:aminoglycoside N(3)-acetyltransferase n=1 Tax=Bacillati TaxID=1783272 RepID=UPI001C6EF63C|nr:MULTISPECIES: AAC(3) family N-acetyltransferase [Terrabacteria group]MBW9212807.1 AAC(3) family N-acetyltransferase [Trueperella sp. zg.1013]
MHDTELSEVLTKGKLISGLQMLGITGSQILEVHTKMSAFNYVIGGAKTIVDGLFELCQNGGTILMPTQVADNSEPSDWKNPPISPELWKTVRQEIPVFDSESSDTHYMGSVVLNFQHRKGVVSSGHPSDSYAAWGRYAKLLVNGQSMHFPLSEESPAARLYELKGYVLLMGVDFSSCTALHLAEYRADCRPVEIQGAMIETKDEHKWKEYLNLQLDSDDFVRVEQILRKKELLRETTICGCPVMLFSAVAAIDEATRYLENASVFDLYR